MRLDRFLAKTLFLSRNEVKKIIRSGEVFVNDVVVRNENFHVNTALDAVFYGEKHLKYVGFYYFLINKPAGYVCANEDNIYPTIIEYSPLFISYNLHTVGRLDLDTTGALLLTNDGKLTHRLISPKSATKKVYIATINEDIPVSLIEIFKAGFPINDEYTTLPSSLEIISPRVARLTLIEGKFHQVKRMFLAFNLQVISLHRESFAGLTVFDLLPGEYRELTAEELQLLIKN